MKKTEDGEQKENDTPQSAQKQDNPSYIFVLWVVAFADAVICFILAYISFCYLDKTASPPPLQFFITSLLSLLVFSAVVVQAIIYWYQWQAMRETLRQNKSLIRASQRQALASEKALNHAKEANTARERAYLGIASITLRGERFVAGEIVQIDIAVKNGGKTPAFNIKAAGQTRICPPKSIQEIEAEAPPPPEQNKIGKRILAGDSERTFFERRYPMTEQALSEIELGTNKFYVVLNLLYVDFEGTEQADVFYYYWNVERSRFMLCGN